MRIQVAVALIIGLDHPVSRFKGDIFLLSFINGLKINLHDHEHTTKYPKRKCPKLQTKKIITKLYALYFDVNYNSDTF